MDGTPLPDGTTYSVQGKDLSQPTLKLDFNGQGSFSFRIPTNFLEDFYGITFTVVSQGLTNTKSDSLAVI